MIKFSDNSSSVMAYLQSHQDVPEKVVREFVRKAVEFVHEGVTSRTPVHTGRSLRNWQWTKGSAFSGNLPDPGGVEPGPTSQMTIGAEPRRSKAQSDSDASLNSLSFNDPLDVYYLTNNSDTIIDLEFGRLPTPDRSRNPAGMVRITFKELTSIMGGFK